VSSQAFDAVSSTVVVLNMVLMSLPYYGMSIEYAAALDRGAIIFNRIYIVEMGMKLYGLGCRGYWGDGWNALDGTIVLTSVVELVLFESVTALPSSQAVAVSLCPSCRCAVSACFGWCGCCDSCARGRT
jgi:hypothetical protein